MVSGKHKIVVVSIILMIIFGLVLVAVISSNNNKYEDESSVKMTNLHVNSTEISFEVYTDGGVTYNSVVIVTTQKDSNNAKHKVTSEFPYLAPNQPITVKVPLISDAKLVMVEFSSAEGVNYPLYDSSFYDMLLTIVLIVVFSIAAVVVAIKVVKYIKEDSKDGLPHQYTVARKIARERAQAEYERKHGLQREPSEPYQKPTYTQQQDANAVFESQTKAPEPPKQQPQPVAETKAQQGFVFESQTKAPEPPKQQAEQQSLKTEQPAAAPKQKAPETCVCPNCGKVLPTKKHYCPVCLAPIE